jgi:hypothetical protein
MALFWNVTYKVHRQKVLFASLASEKTKEKKNQVFGVQIYQML